MPYREPDPDLQAAADDQLAAEDKIEDAAARGREARALQARGVEKRLLRERRPGLAAAVTTMGALVGGYTAALAAGATLPVSLAIGAGAFAVGAGVASGVGRLRRSREHAWAARHDFPVMGYAEVVSTGQVVTAITARITLASIDPDDRDRVIDLLGRLDTVDPVVTIDDHTIAIEALVSGSVKRFARGLIEHVAQPLHATRRVVVVQLQAVTAGRARPGR